MYAHPSSTCARRPAYGRTPSWVASPGRSIASRATVVDATSTKLQPDWTGDKIQSRLVNWLIDTKPVFRVLQTFAKKAVRGYAEKRGIDWVGHVKRMQSPQLSQEIAAVRSEIERTDIVYPSYYVQPFHAYAEGNLNWLAAYEVEPATYAMAVRTFKDDTSLTPHQAFHKLRGQINAKITEYQAKHGVPTPHAIIDMGCSTGMSTRVLAELYPQAQVTGLDLSPHFLAVAEWEERTKKHAGKRIKFIHSFAENSGLEGGAYDLIAHNFVIHECTQDAISSFIVEAHRLLRPGGMLLFVDNNPRSETIQKLPPAIATLMKSTEPWSDQYYAYDVEANMAQRGFRNVETAAADHRHRAVMGIKA